MYHVKQNSKAELDDIHTIDTTSFYMYIYNYVRIGILPIKDSFDEKRDHEQQLDALFPHSSTVLILLPNSNDLH